MKPIILFMLLVSSEAITRSCRSLASMSVDSGKVSSSRRRILDNGIAIGLGVTVGNAPKRGLAADDVAIEKVIPAAELVGGLATSPKRSIIITGANSGVGLEGAKLLVAAGHDVVCACRTEAKAQGAVDACIAYAAANPNPRRSAGLAEPAVCDLADFDSIRAFATRCSQRPGVNTLVLNAGLALNTADKAPKRTAQGLELTVGTNHFGHFLLASLLTKSLRSPEDGGPRLVVTASPVHDPSSPGGGVGSQATLGDFNGLESGTDFEMIDGAPYDADKAYKDSKLCNMLFTAEAARRLKPQGVTVNAFSPGLIASPNGFFRYQNPVFATVFNGITNLVGVSETAQFGGSCLAYMAADASLGTTTGGWYDTYPPGKHQLAVHQPSAEAQDLEKQARLWNFSARVTGVAA